MRLKELEEYLSCFLQVPLIKDYCPNGLQVEGKEEIQRIATAVSANLMTLERAAHEEVDALIVHHGLFWQGDPYSLTGTKRTKIELLLRKNISLFAYHLPLDAHREVGNNWQAARDLGWQELAPFGDYLGTTIGVKGVFPSTSIDRFIENVETYYGHFATVALGGKKAISNCALISGGAHKDLMQAIHKGMDCFITGNYDEPAWSIAYENRINFLALGHSATERVGPKALADHLQNTLKIPSYFIDVQNPF